VAAAAALGVPEPEAVRPFGAAYGVAGLLRANSVLAAQGRCLLPADVLARHDLSPEAFLHEPGGAPAQAALHDVVREGQAFLAQGRGVPRAATAAALPAVLARRDMRRWPEVAVPRRFGDRMAVTIAGLRGRV
jgi:phytoene synthase